AGAVSPARVQLDRDPRPADDLRAGPRGRRAAGRAHPGAQHSRGARAAPHAGRRAAEGDDGKAVAGPEALGCLPAESAGRDRARPTPGVGILAEILSVAVRRSSAPSGATTPVEPCWIGYLVIDDQVR